MRSGLARHVGTLFSYRLITRSRVMSFGIGNMTTSVIMLPSTVIEHCAAHSITSSARGSSVLECRCREPLHIDDELELARALDRWIGMAAASPHDHVWVAAATFGLGSPHRGPHPFDVPSCRSPASRCRTKTSAATTGRHILTNALHDSHTIKKSCEFSVPV